MLHAGLDLSRKKADVCLLSDGGDQLDQLDQLAVAPDVDSLRTLAHRIEEVHHQPVCAVIESMTGARIVHDTLEAEGWSVEIADAQKVKGSLPWPADRQDRRRYTTWLYEASRLGSRRGVSGVAELHRLLEAPID